jgi:PLP dependent protein
MTDEGIRTRLAERFSLVEERIQASCRKVGRNREEITLVAVTKTVSIQVVRLVAEMGYLDLGENRPQEFWRKATALKEYPIRWHLIGHLQRNKVEKTLQLRPERIHSIDSIRLLQAIDSEAGKQSQRISGLLEINVSREANKHGFAPEEVPTLRKELEKLQNVRIDGMMTMAAYSDNPETSRATFRELREWMPQVYFQKGCVYFPLTQLSMGMSNDFEIAIEEGATLIRLGTILFDGLPNEESE